MRFQKKPKTPPVEKSGKPAVPEPAGVPAPASTVPPAAAVITPAPPDLVLNDSDKTARERMFGNVQPADRPPEKTEINEKFPPDKYLYINGKLARDRHGNEMLRPEAKGKPGRKPAEVVPIEPERKYGDENDSSKVMANQVVGGLVIWMNGMFGYSPPDESQEALQTQLSRYFYYRNIERFASPEIALVLAIAGFTMPAFQTEKGKDFIKRFQRRKLVAPNTVTSPNGNPRPVGTQAQTEPRFVNPSEL